MPDIFQAKSNKPPVIQPGQNNTAPASAATPNPNPTLSKATPTQTIDNLPQTAMSLFSTLAVKPQGVNFANQDPDENVLLFFRAAFITNFFWIFTTLVLLFVPLVFIFFAPIINLSTAMLTSQANFIVLYFYYLLVFSYALVSFMYWFYNVGIVSSKHIIGVVFADVTYKNISTTPLQEVADIDYTQQGFSQTFFNYGTVTVRTEGMSPQIDFTKVPQPGKVTDTILQIREAMND